MTPLVTTSLVRRTAGVATAESTPSATRTSRTKRRARGTLAGSGGRVRATTALLLDAVSESLPSCVETEPWRYACHVSRVEHFRDRRNLLSDGGGPLVRAQLAAAAATASS